MDKAMAAGMPEARFSSPEQPFELERRLDEVSALGRPSAGGLKGTLLATSRLLSLLAATLIAFAPMHALAQDSTQESTSVRERPRPEYDPLGMRVGGFDLNAGLELSATQTDNLFATETGEEDDTIFHVKPYASLTSHWSRHALGLYAGLDDRTHSDFESEDVTTYYLRGNGRLDIGSNSSLFGSAGFAHNVESRYDPDATTFGDPIEYDVSNAEVGARHQFNRFAVQAAVGHREYDFDDAPNRDSETDYVTGRIEAALSPRITGFAQVTADERTYDTSPGLSSDGRRYLAGVGINFSDLLRGEVGVGYFERDYDSGAQTDGLAVSADLEWDVTRLTTVTLTADRSGEDRAGILNAPYVQSSYGVRVDHELLRNLILSGDVAWGQREYESPFDRDDDFSTVGVGAEYLMNRRVALFGRAERIEVDSSGADAYRSFEANEVTVGVRFRL